MRDTRVEEVEHISSDSDSDENPGTGSQGDASQELTVGIFPNHVQQGMQQLRTITIKIICPLQSHS